MSDLTLMFVHGLFLGTAFGMFITASVIAIGLRR